MGVASLILGIVAIVFGLVPLPIPGKGIIGLICAIVGVILGAVGRKKAKNAGQPTGAATAGMVLSIISLILDVIAVIVTVACVGVIGSSLGLF